MFADRPDVLLFETEPLRSDTEVTGSIHARIYLSADVSDLDLWVRLLDVHPDGASYNLMSPGLDVIRASYRNRSVTPELLVPGTIYRLDLDDIPTSHVFRARHRIRIQISGAFAPHLSRNLQTGESEITSARAQIGHIRIYHDADYPSQVVVPIIPR